MCQRAQCSIWLIALSLPCDQHHRVIDAMKSYPSIPSSRDRTIPIGQPCLGFMKYDGSNLRWEWSKKQGWHKFGTRNRLFGPEEAPYNQAIPIFLEHIGPIVEENIRHEFKGVQEIVAFTEFMGPSSFAGSHVLEEPKALKLIDVSVYKKGIIPPRHFMKLFGKHDFAPELLYEGNFSRELIFGVRAGVYDRPVDVFGGFNNIPFEGMVCKGADHRGQVWMAKIKTDAYLNKLRAAFGDEWAKYGE